MGVTILQIELHRTLRFCPTTADLCDRVFEPVRQIDTDAMRLFGHGIENWLSGTLEHARNIEMGATALDINRNVDFREDCIMDLFIRGRKDLKECRSGF